MALSYDNITNDRPLTTSKSGYRPTDEEWKIISKLDKMFEASKKSRQNKVSRWRRNEELYNGDFFRPFKMPKYKSRIVANTVHSTVETIYSIVTDRPPKVDVMPRTEDQVETALIAQDAVESEMQKHKFTRAVAHMKRDGLIYGNGFLKVCIIDGVIHYVNPDPFSVFVDPLCTSVQDAKYVTFAVPTYIDDIKSSYDRGKFVVAEGNLDEFRSFKLKTDSTSETRDIPVETKSPVDTTQSDSDVLGGQALLKECHFYEDGKLMLATWCGSVLLQYEENPYVDIPLVTFQNYADAHKFWGKGEPEVIETLAVGTAILLSQGIDNIIYHGNPGIVMSKSMAKTPGNLPTDKPGQIFYTNGPHEAINRLPAGNISSSTLPMAQTLMQMADQVSGVHDITQGRNPSGVTSGRAISQLQEASQQIIRAKEREIGTDAVIDCYKKTLELLHYNYENPISIRKSPDTGSGYEFNTIMPMELDPNMDFKYVPGSSMPESRAQRMDQAFDLIQLGLLDSEKFWRWIQKDISKEILDEILEQKQMENNRQQQLMQIMSQSTDPEEIMNAKLELSSMMGTLPQGGEEPQK